ncbi:uncharacterized protein LOC142554642 [Primulina tabacum]|uniref:uncharacterized protein LOC142554642 n=1 Tax=Primulina tabacum TaxID=48773 RepID=UPI003F59A787
MTGNHACSTGSSMSAGAYGEPSSALFVDRRATKQWNSRRAQAPLLVAIEVDPSKVKAVRDCPVPKSVTEICSFRGLVGYYRKFIQSFSSIAMPMTALTKKNAKCIEFWFGPGSDAAGQSDSLRVQTAEGSLAELPESLTRSSSSGVRPEYLETLSKELNMRQMRWLEMVKDYDCDINYHPGKTNVG